MKVKRAPLVAASIIVLFGGTIPPALTQLPPTNMGKWVHQPGDNQYGNQAQHDRHYVPQAAPAPMQGGGGGGGMAGGGGGMAGWRPTPPPVKADISLDPIAADEPVAAVGFPPLPDRLELPVQSSWGGGGRGGAGYGRYGGASPPGMNGGGGGPPQITGTHQHYNHYEPGAFAPPGQSGGGGGGGGVGSPGQSQGQSHGYYKARTPEPPRNPSSDYYNNNTAGGTPGAPGMAASGPSDAMRALKGLGKEPKLNKTDTAADAPEAPQPVVVNQATTQDLSLPEDDFAYQKPTTGNRTMKRLGKQVKRAIVRPINSAAGRFGTGISF